MTDRTNPRCDENSLLQCRQGSAGKRMARRGGVACSVHSTAGVSAGPRRFCGPRRQTPWSRSGHAVCCDRWRRLRGCQKSLLQCGQGSAGNRMARRGGVACLAHSTVGVSAGPSPFCGSRRQMMRPRHVLRSWAASSQVSGLIPQLLREAFQVVLRSYQRLGHHWTSGIIVFLCSPSQKKKKKKKKSSHCSFFFFGCSR